MAQGLLKDNGIEAMLSSDDCGGYRSHLTLESLGMVILFHLKNMTCRAT